jgi:DegV family protein with EDD domain
MSVAVVSDTCHYLPAELAAAEGIHQVSLYVRWPEGDQRESDITDYDAYYQRLSGAPDLPSTSQPSIGDFLAVYEPLLDAGHEIVSVHLAGGMSGTVRSAEQAREQLGERAASVYVVDSASACGGEGLVVLAAAAAARGGADGSAVAERAREARSALKMWFAVDTLEYLRRGGRIAGAQAWLGSALRIKPILTVESEITPVERVRTSKRAFERMVDLLRSRAEDGADAYMVQHIQAPEQAQELAARATEIFGVPPRVISEIGPVIGTHVGPGLLGAGGLPSFYLS